MFQYLWHNELMPANAQLGLVEFGSEAYHSGNNVTFSAGSFSMGVWPGDPPRYELNTVGDGCKAPSSPTKSVAAAKMLGGQGQQAGQMALLAAGVASLVAVAGDDGVGLGGVLGLVLGTGLLWRSSGF